MTKYSNHKFVNSLIILLITLCVSSVVNAEGSLENNLNLPRSAQWGLHVIEAKRGREVLQEGTLPQGPLTPASLVKLCTAGAVSESASLGAETMLLHDGDIVDGTLDGNLYLYGKGNALLTADDMQRVTHALVQKGIRRVKGAVVGDSSYFDTKGLERTRKGAGHAPAGALGLDLHTVAVSVIPTEPGKPPKVTVEPPNASVKLAVSATTIARGNGSISITQIDDTSYRVTGNIPTARGAMKRRFPLADPARYAAETFKTILRQEGITVEGGVGSGKPPADANLLVEIPGPPLKEILGRMNTNSLNVVADNLLLALGAEKYGAPGTLEKGVRAVTEFLQSLDLPMNEVKNADGSGLSSENRVTARFMAEYLQRVSRKPWFRDFCESLPRAGIDGTLKDLGYRNERFRVKSGRLENVYSLAGYGVDAKGREIAFAFIVNTPGASAMNLEQTGADVMRYLASEALP